MKLNIYWLESVINFMVPSQKNTLSIVSVLQPKALHFHYFILTEPCFLQFLGQMWMTTILLRDKFHHLFYQDLVNNKVLLIFRLKFVQDSQMLLLPKVQTIVAQFLDMTWCVQFLQIITPCANTGNLWLHQTLKPVVWV